MTKVIDKTADVVNSLRFYFACLVAIIFIVPLAVAFVITCIHHGGY